MEWMNIKFSHFVKATSMSNNGQPMYPLIAFNTDEGQKVFDFTAGQLLDIDWATAYDMLVDYMDSHRLGYMGGSYIMHHFARSPLAWIHGDKS
jgi:hypothetical protein